MAAIHAHRANPDLKIFIVDKSTLETGGAVGMGMDALNVMPLPPASHPEDLLEMLNKITEGVLDQDVAWTFAKLCPGLVAELEEITGRNKGDLFPVDDYGNYVLRYVHPVNSPMLLPMDGANLKLALARRARQTGVEVFERTAVIDILTRNGSVCGVLGFDFRTGHYHHYHAPVVCLTAGPAGRVGLPSSGHLSGTYEFPGNSGDGYTLAYRAGAELVNMECFQALVMLKDMQTPACGYVAGTRGAYSSDRLGNQGNTHHFPSGDTRLTAWCAMVEGRTPISLHMDHLPEDVIKLIEFIQHGNERTARGVFHRGRGQDYRDKQGLELGVIDEITACGGHSSSGVLSDSRGRTNVQGLLVAGDVDGGLPFCFLSGALVMGGVIGEEAAVQLTEGYAVSPATGKAEIKKRIVEFEAPLRCGRGLPPGKVEYKARTRLGQYLRPPKNPAYLELAVWWMERIRREDLPRIKARDYHELIKSYEIESILTVGEMMAKASLYRDESRWGYQHWRVDMPAKDPKWDRTWVVIHRGPDGMRLGRRQTPEPKWSFPDYMEYSYPDLKFEVGPLFKKGPDYKNPVGDPWMAAKLATMEKKED
jgi:succinate dehydrogenase/fumarate reductase flavoprotein subunit